MIGVYIGIVIGMNVDEALNYYLDWKEGRERKKAVKDDPLDFS
jgi:hypothetical protein